jgi:hypothetical protein
MRLLKGIGRWLWRFMVIFSFIVNLVLVVVLIGAAILIYDIKNNIAQPLVGGLHSTAIGLQNATIDWTIPVRDNIPVVLNIPLKTDTTVILTAPVPLQVNATIDLPGINAYGVSANVNLTLPQGLQLPVALDLMVPVNERLDVALDVRAVIPLAETQLADPINQLGLLFEPLALGLHNLPNDWNGGIQMITKVLNGEPINLLATDGTGGINSQAYQAWAGYSQTAGLNYTLLNQPVPSESLPRETGIVPAGGIPLLDSMLPSRSDLYADGGTPQTNNQASREALENQGIPPIYYDGSYSSQYTVMNAVSLNPPIVESGGGGNDTIISPTDGTTPAVGGATSVQGDDFGIIVATPTNP